MRRETPIEWQQALERAGLHSARDLARELEVSPQTATRLIYGEQTSRETIEAAAVLLGITPDHVRAMRREVALPPFRLPAEADQLSPRQRAAIVAVVRAMLETHSEPAANTTARADRAQEYAPATESEAREAMRESAHLERAANPVSDPHTSQDGSTVSNPSHGRNRP